jgi:maltose O-acetyltransferase
MFGNFIRIIQRNIKQRTLDDLIRRGLTVGTNVGMMDDCMIDGAHCWLISIGNHVQLAARVQILAHDASTKMFLGYDKIGRVVIGNDVFIGQNSIILPNVTIGNRVVIGAGSIVTKDIPSNSVAAGNPARVKCTLDEYLERNRLLMKQRPVYDESWTLRKGITPSMKEKMKTDLEDGVGFLA